MVGKEEHRSWVLGRRTFCISTLRVIPPSGALVATGAKGSKWAMAVMSVLVAPLPIRPWWCQGIEGWRGCCCRAGVLWDPHCG